MGLMLERVMAGLCEQLCEQVTPETSTVQALNPFEPAQIHC